MRSRRLVKTLGWTALLFTCAAVACDGPRKEDVPQAEPVTIPLESIYSTNGQEGLMPIVRRPGQPYESYLDILRSKVHTGASNVFLARGKDITAAIRATTRVFTGGRSADGDADPEDGSNSEQVWLVAYFGIAGSQPPAWIVNSLRGGRQGSAFRSANRFAKCLQKIYIFTSPGCPWGA